MPSVADAVFIKVEAHTDTVVADAGVEVILEWGEVPGAGNFLEKLQRRTQDCLCSPFFSITRQAWAEIPIDLLLIRLGRMLREELPPVSMKSAKRWFRSISLIVSIAVIGFYFANCIAGYPKADRVARHRRRRNRR